MRSARLTRRGSQRAKIQAETLLLRAHLNSGAAEDRLGVQAFDSARRVRGLRCRAVEGSAAQRHCNLRAAARCELRC